MRNSPQIKRSLILLKLVSFVAFLVVVPPASAASPAAKTVQPSPDSWSWSSISNRWGALPLEQLRQQADHNEGSAQYFLGWLYESGKMGDASQSEAAKWYRTSAEQGFAPAQFLLGRRNETQTDPGGNTIVGNYQVASEWFEKAAAQGHAQAMLHLGDLYYFGKLERDHNAAAKWFRLAAEKGNDEAVLRLGELYLHNRGDLLQDHAESAKWFRTAAEKGNSEAQYQLGLLLLDGQGTPHDTAQARGWLQKAANQGHAKAIVKLSALSEEHPGLTSRGRDELEALAANGGAPAVLALGIDYEEGRTGPANLYRAAGLYWRVLNLYSPFKQGMEPTISDAIHRLVRLYSSQKVEPLPTAPESAQPAQGVPDFYSDLAPKSGAELTARFKSRGSLVERTEDQASLGEMFYAGKVVPANLEEAVNWFLKAAQAGNADAMNRIGELWAAGVDGTPDPKEAVHWFRRAAKKGCASAQSNLGKAYFHGQGVDQDLVQAWTWLEAASGHGSKIADSDLKEIESQLTPEQLRQAQESAAKLFFNPPNDK